MTDQLWNNIVPLCFGLMSLGPETDILGLRLRLEHLGPHSRNVLGKS